MKIHNLTDDQKDKVVEIVQRCYGGIQSHSTDIYLIDGEIVELNHAGSTTPQNYDLFIMSIKPEHISGYKGVIQSDMTDKQIEDCKELGWFSIYESKSDDKKNWERFEVEDDTEFEHNVRDKIENVLLLQKEEFAYFQSVSA